MKRRNTFVLCVGPQCGATTITLDHHILASLAAPSGLHGPVLVVSFALAEWAILLGPLTLVVLWLVGPPEDRAAAVSTAAAASLALAIAAALSSLIDAPRPFVDGGAFNYLDHVRDGSFPSDHATLAFAIAVGIWRWRPSRAPVLWLPLMVVAIAIGWARVFLGAHYPTDIAGGAIVGSAAVAAIGTPLARAAIRRLDAVGDRVRAHALAGWYRVLPPSIEGRDP